MWKSISQFLSFLFTYNDKFNRHDRQIEDLERKLNTLTNDTQMLMMRLERQSERDQWREENFRQALELERLHHEKRQLVEPRPALPPAPRSKKPKKA